MSLQQNNPLPCSIKDLAIITKTVTYSESDMAFIIHGNLNLLMIKGELAKVNKPFTGHELREVLKVQHPSFLEAVNIIYGEDFLSDQKFITFDPKWLTYGDKMFGFYLCTRLTMLNKTEEELNSSGDFLDNIEKDIRMIRALDVKNEIRLMLHGYVNQTGQVDETKIDHINKLLSV